MRSMKINANIQFHYSRVRLCPAREINPKNIQNPGKFTRTEGKPEFGKGGGPEVTTPNSIKVTPEKIISFPKK